MPRYVTRPGPVFKPCGPLSDTRGSPSWLSRTAAPVPQVPGRTCFLPTVCLPPHACTPYPHREPRPEQSPLCSPRKELSPSHRPAPGPPANRHATEVGRRGPCPRAPCAPPPGWGGPTWCHLTSLRPCRLLSAAVPVMAAPPPPAPGCPGVFHGLCHLTSATGRARHRELTQTQRPLIQMATFRTVSGVLRGPGCARQGGGEAAPGPHTRSPFR